MSGRADRRELLLTASWAATRAVSSLVSCAAISSSCPPSVPRHPESFHHPASVRFLGLVPGVQQLRPVVADFRFELPSQAPCPISTRPSVWLRWTDGWLLRMISAVSVGREELLQALLMGMSLRNSLPLQPAVVRDRSGGYQSDPESVLPDSVGLPMPDQNQAGAICFRRQR